MNKGLFEIFAIDKDTDKIIFNSKIVAEGEKEALFESSLKETLKEKNIKRNDVHLVIKEISKIPN